jgi:hypothetical protein
MRMDISRSPIIGIIRNRLARQMCALALAAPALACLSLPAVSEMEATMIDISHLTLEKTPAGFIFARTGRGGEGEWKVVADPTAAGGRAIEQTSTDRTDYRFPLAIHDSLSAADLTGEIRFKAVAGRIDQAGGIAVRLIDADNYYVARANALEDNVRFYRVVHGQREQLGGANLKVTANEWHSLVLRAEGERFTVVYDGATPFSVTDKTFAEAGGVALWTKADSVTRFDKLTVTPLR